jgi:hypothetical protein
VIGQSKIWEFFFFFFFNKKHFLLNNAGSLTKSKRSLSEADWQKKLTPEQFYVTREKGTEAVSSVPSLVFSEDAAEKGR